MQKGFFTNLFKSFRKSARLNSNQCSLTEQKLKQIQTSTDKGILLRMNRSIQVEGAFGVLKQDYGFGRFLTRGRPTTKPAFLSSQQHSISENFAVGLLTDDSGKHCLNRKQPEITFREQQNLSRSVCRTQKSHFLHEPASLEPKNVMFGTPRIALLKKERCCCKYDLILQQPRTVCIIEKI